jgi:hypothetical protein
LRHGQVAQFDKLPYRRLAIGWVCQWQSICRLPTGDTADYQSAVRRQDMAFGKNPTVLGRFQTSLNDEYLKALSRERNDLSRTRKIKSLAVFFSNKRFWCPMSYFEKLPLKSQWAAILKAPVESERRRNLSNPKILCNPVSALLLIQVGMNGPH